MFGCPWLSSVGYLRPSVPKKNVEAGLFTLRIADSGIEEMLFSNYNPKSAFRIPQSNGWQGKALPLKILFTSFCLIITCTLLCRPVFAQTPTSQNPDSSPRTQYEYLWYEAENMRGFAETERHEPVLNPSWMNPMRAQAQGWGMNGPGVSAEWSQGGESEWNSAAASADETRATIYQDVEVPRA